MFVQFFILNYALFYDRNYLITGTSSSILPAFRRQSLTGVIMYDQVWRQL